MWIASYGIHRWACGLTDKSYGKLGTEWINTVLGPFIYHLGVIRQWWLDGGFYCVIPIRKSFLVIVNMPSLLCHWSPVAYTVTVQVDKATPCSLYRMTKEQCSASSGARWICLHMNQPCLCYPSSSLNSQTGLFRSNSSMGINEVCCEHLLILWQRTKDNAWGKCWCMMAP